MRLHKGRVGPGLAPIPELQCKCTKAGFPHFSVKLILYTMNVMLHCKMKMIYIIFFIPCLVQRLSSFRGVRASVGIKWMGMKKNIVSDVV